MLDVDEKMIYRLTLSNIDPLLMAFATKSRIVMRGVLPAFDAEVRRLER